MMDFTKQDAITFGIGLGVALVFQTGVALASAGDQVSDVGAWALSLGTGLVTAAGRYIVTYFTERGIKGA